MALFIIPQCALDSPWDCTPNYYIRFSGHGSQALPFFKSSLGDSDSPRGLRKWIYGNCTPISRGASLENVTHTSTINLPSPILKALNHWHQREIAGIRNPGSLYSPKSPDSDMCVHKLKVTEDLPLIGKAPEQSRTHCGSTEV